MTNCAEFHYETETVTVEYNGASFGAAASPYEIPDKLTWYSDPTLRVFLIEFDYISSMPTYVAHDYGHFKIRVATDHPLIIGIEIDLIWIDAARAEYHHSAWTDRLIENISDALQKIGHSREKTAELRKIGNPELVRQAIVKNMGAIFSNISTTVATQTEVGNAKATSRTKRLETLVFCLYCIIAILSVTCVTMFLLSYYR